jgi:predicted RNase H-like nuclease
MVRFVGIDLAWGARARTGVAVLDRVIPYKHKHEHKRGRDLVALRRSSGILLDHLERVAGPTLHLAEPPRWVEIRRTVGTAVHRTELRAVEDEVDAVVWAYLALLWGRRDERMRVLGDVDRGYIVVPVPPPVPPAARRHRTTPSLEV